LLKKAGGEKLGGFCRLCPSTEGPQKAKQLLPPCKGPLGAGAQKLHTPCQCWWTDLCLPCTCWCLRVLVIYICSQLRNTTRAIAALG